MPVTFCVSAERLLWMHCMYKSKEARMIKKIKSSKVSRDEVLQKMRKQGIRFWDERTCWHKIIYNNLIPAFGFL